MRKMRTVVSCSVLPDGREEHMVRKYDDWGNAYHEPPYTDDEIERMEAEGFYAPPKVIVRSRVAAPVRREESPPPPEGPLPEKERP